MEQIHVTENPKGIFSTNIHISTEEWQQILANPALTTANYRKALRAFLTEPEHQSSCTALSLKYYGDGKSAQKYNSWITNFGKVVAKHLNRFQIIDAKGDERYWHVPMCEGHKDESGHFVTKLRPELVTAMETLGWHKNLTWIPFYQEMADRLLAYKDNRGALVDLVYGLDSSFVGYIKTQDGGKVSDIDPFTVFGIFNRGINDDSRIKLCQYFKDKLGIEANVPIDFDGIPVLNNMKAVFFWEDNAAISIPLLWTIFETALTIDETMLSMAFDKALHQHGIKWNITMGLYWIRPNEYLPLDSRTREYLPTLGIEVFKENQLDAEYYLTLLSVVKQKITDNEISEQSISEISYHAWIANPSSNTTNMNRSYWLVGITIDDKPQSKRFLEENIWESRYNDSKTSDQNLLELAKTIKEGDVIILKSTSTKGKKHDQPFLRVSGIGIVEGNLKQTKKDTITQCKCPVRYIDHTMKDFDGPTFGSYRKTIHLADDKANDIVAYANSVLTQHGIPVQSVSKKYKEYIELLQNAHNLVFTGAPGTGKTYMAKEIAKEMGCTGEEIEFVQFHPSYDYTDFVEGLRPIDKGDGQIGFERKDGVFKLFCKKAIKNLEDSAKSLDELNKERSWEDNLQEFIANAIENDTTFTLSNGSEFTIEEIRDRTIIVYNKQNEKTTHIAVNANEVIDLLVKRVALHNVKDIRCHFRRKNGSQPDSYTFIITKEISKMGVPKSNDLAKKIARKPFVFIIDEINRGEASKIFGELFGAIDPGYRGKKDVMVKTQYQNLVPESDTFADGFYVPENVYILATMNDIDRSVESMDFAMRRRFTWKEISPKDTESMLDSLDCATQAKETLDRLNKAISEEDGLGSAYQIGPSYFLKLKDYDGDFDKLWEMHIEPLLKEYLRGFPNAKEAMEAFKNVYDGKVNSSTTQSDED